MSATTAASGTTGTAGGRPARRVMPGVDGFWVFIGGDLMIFTLLFLSFLLARADDIAGFETARLTLSIDRGGINTLLLLTSSACVAQAVHSLRAGLVPQARLWIAGGLLGGLGFIAFKASEYASGLGDGHTPEVSDFFTYYYAITGLHLFHVIAGCIALAAYLWRLGHGPLRTAKGFETAACYWHVVDFLWLVIFPLVYLVR